MSRRGCIFAMAVVFAASAGLAEATSPQARDAWLKQNYRFTGPQGARATSFPDTSQWDMRQVQDTLLSNMRRAYVDEYYDASIAAAVQAAYAIMLGAANTTDPRGVSGSPDRVIAYPPQAAPAGPVAPWSDGLMMHYITPEGTHVQVRLDLVGHPFH